MRPRVTFVVPAVAPLMGMERALLLLATALAELCEVRVLCFADPGAVRPRWPRAVALETLGLPTDHLLLVRAVRHLGGRLDDPGETVVGVSLWGTAPLLALGRRIRGRIVHWEHSLLPWRWRHDPVVRWLARTVRALGSRLDAGVCVSPPVAASLSRVLDRPLPLVTIANAVTIATTKSTGRPPLDGPVTLLASGSLRAVKNFDALVGAMPLLPDRIRLDIAGDGALRARLARLIHRRGLAGRVRLLGHVDRLDGIRRRYHLYVQPSHAETFGMAVVEAGMAGVPVVVSGRPALDHLVPSRIVGVAAADASPQALASAVGEAVRRLPELERSAAAAAPSLRRAFDPATIAREWLATLTP